MLSVYSYFEKGSRKKCAFDNPENSVQRKQFSDSPGLVDFATGLVNYVFNLPNGQVMFFEEFEQQKNCDINSARQKA